MRDIRVATVQFQHAAGDKAYNFGRIRHFVTAAAGALVEMIAFPEMCLTGYWHVRRLSRAAFEALAEPVPEGPSTRDLLQLSREHGITVGAGLLERASDGAVYNAYVVAMPDGAWAVHRKLHVFEHPNMCAGSRYTVFDTPHACRVGVLICYDNNIVENARATALLGAEILLAPHQTGGCNSVSPRGMKPIDPAVWARRHEDPAQLRLAPRGPTPTACVCFSRTASARTTMLPAPATRWCSIPMGTSSRSRGRWATTWWSRISTRRSCPRHPAGAGCGRAGPSYM